MQGIIFILVLYLVIIAFINRIKRGITSYDLFVLVYFAVLLLWPSFQGLRFLFPIIPFYFLLSLEGIQHLIDVMKSPKWLLNAVSLLVFLILAVNYTGAYTNLIPRPKSDIDKRETQELFQFVKSRIQSDEIVAFFKPRVLALFTERKSVAVAVPPPSGDTLNRLNELNVRYVIVRLNHSWEYQPQMNQLIMENPNQFRLVYNNDEFLVYQYLNVVP